MDKQKFLEDYIVKRHGTDCYKWDDLESRYGDKDLISMWVADMEFKTCDQILEAMTKRIEHGVFGYSCVADEYYQVFSDWMEKRYQFPLKKEWVRFSTGCVTGIAWMINAFTQPGDTCLILTPVYYPFHNVVTNNGRKLVSVDLDYQDGHFSMNYEAIEKAVVDNQVKMFIQCSPHNPAGRVWTEEEMEKVLVVSDEIHQDILLDGHKFTPAAVVKDGALNRTEMNIMGLTATMAAYTYGGEWMENVFGVIEDNYHYLKDTLNRMAPQITVCDLEGTYLVLLDLRKSVEQDRVKEFTQDRCRLAVDYGEWFGENFKGFIRLNLATDPAYVRQATDNIIKELRK